MVLEIIALAAGLAAALALLLAAAGARHARENPLVRYAHGEATLGELAGAARGRGVQGIATTAGSDGSLRVKVYGPAGDIWTYSTREPHELERLIELGPLRKVGIHVERVRGPTEQLPRRVRRRLRY